MNRQNPGPTGSLGRGHQPIQKLKKRRWGHRMSDGSRNDEDEVRRDGFAMLAVLLLTIALIIYVGWNVI